MTTEQKTRCRELTIQEHPDYKRSEQANQEMYRVSWDSAARRNGRACSIWMRSLIAIQEIAESEECKGNNPTIMSGWFAGKLF